jgi:hypothetical protein
MNKIETFLSAIAILCIIGFMFILFGFTSAKIYPYAHDGDTIEVWDSLQHKQIGLRIANIDAPELLQNFGINSRDSLQKMISNCKMKIKIQNIDKYGRNVSIVYFNDKRFDSISIANGWSYVYRPYLSYPKLLLVEAIARSKHLGVWAIQPQLRPWDYRKQKK